MTQTTTGRMQVVQYSNTRIRVSLYDYIYIPIQSRNVKYCYLVCLNTLTPAFNSRLDASSGSKFEGIGCTGRSLVLMPRC